MSFFQINGSVWPTFRLAFSAVKNQLRRNGAFSHLPKPFSFRYTPLRSLHSSNIQKLFHSALPIALSTLMICQISAISGLSIEPVYKKIITMTEIPTVHPNDTLILFDLDDTTFDSPYMVGSRAWRKYIAQATKGADQNWHDIFSLFLAKKLKVTAIESSTNSLISTLQKKGYGVCGLTSREREVWYTTPTPGIDELTIQQLRMADIVFNSDVMQSKYPELVKDSEYFQGVFFADTDLKGDYLKKILSASQRPLPKKIVFIDDKLSQVESVGSVLQEMGIDYECYWYCASDHKASQFNPRIANIQLYYLLISGGVQVLSDQEANIIAQEHSEKADAYFLEAAINYSKEIGIHLL